MHESAIPPCTRGESFDEFRSAVFDEFVPLTMSSDNVGAFRGYARVRPAGVVGLSEVAVSHGIVQRRTPRLISQVDRDLLKVNIVARGRCRFAQDGRQALLGAGDFVLYDTSRPYEFSSEDGFQIYGVIVPREMVRLPRKRLEHLTAERFGHRDGVGSLVSAFLLQLGNQLRAGRYSTSVHLGNTALDMLTASFAERLTVLSTLDPSIRRTALTRHIEALIESRLHDPGLDVAAVAVGSHVSVRQLHRIFEEQGSTVGGWIRSRRLENCRRDLANVEYADIPVGTLAARWGFTNLANFSRAFKGVHGVAPSVYRAAVLSEHSDAGIDRRSAGVRSARSIAT